MDIKTTLQNCIGVLGQIPCRVDQIHTISEPCVQVIQALVQVINELDKEQKDATENVQGE